ncbi:MAG: acyl-CoA dehydrogenase family protein [Candidatus Thermoplasmatota archaeon]
MPYTLSEDEVLIQKVVREFATTQVGLDRAADQDRHDRFPSETMAAAAGLGLTTMTVPAEQGGAGVTATAFALAIHELAKVDPNAAAILAVHNGLALRFILQAGDAVRARVVQAAAAGEVVAFLGTEEASGSDVASLGTTAVPSQGGYRITGQKVWAVAASDAKHFVVLADAKGGATPAPTLFYVPASAAGITLGNNEPLLGLRAAGIRTVYLSSVQVPAENRIGDVGQGLALLKAERPWLQVAAAAALAGCVAGAFTAAADFATSRIQFGQPIGTYQAVSDGVVTMDVQAHACLALTLEAAAHLGADDAPLWAARAKAFANEMAIPMTRQAIRIQGGTGFMREGGTERFARDARALQFLGETTQMQRDLIKRAVLPDVTFPATP